MKSVPRRAMRWVVGSVLLSVVALGRRACVAVLAQEGDFLCGKMDPVSPRKPHPHSVDLLRNRSLTLPLGPFDGTVGAFAQIGAQHYFITSNADYVPAVPSITVPHAVFLRSDMRYGTDDPTLWPQQWTADYPHMPLISTKGSRPELDVMWWDPLPTDFAVGSAVTRGLGRLTHARFSRLLPPINELVARCKELHRTSPALAIPLFGALIQHITMWLEQLQTLPTTYPKMVFGLTSLQRAFLELDALYNYMTIYQARMNNYMAPASADTSVAKFVGAFTTVPSVAQQLWAAKVPFWFLRPVDVFDADNILKVVPLREPEFDLPDANAHGAGAPPFYTAATVPWKRLRRSSAPPFIRRGIVTRLKPLTPVLARLRPSQPHPLQAALAQPCTRVHNIANPTTAVPVALGSPPVARNRPQQSRSKPYSGKPPAPKGPVKTERDKFSPLLIQEMPPSIVSMANALALVDRSVTPYTSKDADKRYVLPEPALLVNTAPERRCKFLHHWNLLSDGFIYMLTQHPQLLRPQEWRDVLEGLLTKCGPVGSPRYRRSERLLDCIRPALQACHLSSVEGFPVPVECLPEFSIEQTREIVWQTRVAEESAGRGQGLFCWAYAGGGAIGDEPTRLGCNNTRRAPPLCQTDSDSDAGLDDPITSPKYYPSCRRPYHELVPYDMEALESAVCCYYTQAFWEHFGRAAVVPLRLDHELEKEDGEL
ncbi:hypothetical protein B0H13DRAFT_1929041 [Mycena leptocephala]|nr:hypothetical protein B0H13DRAFT_1929041 [Mycena leptocephala]